MLATFLRWRGAALLGLLMIDVFACIFCYYSKIVCLMVLYILGVTYFLNN